MILPGSYLFTILLLVLSFICWGSWVNTFKAAGKWRFELFYFDFALGALIVAVICALTVGTLGWDGFSFMDDIRLAGKKQDLFALTAGGVFNLGNMLLLAGISIAGITVAFPVGAGIALAISSVLSYAVNRNGNPLIVAVGSLFILGAVVFNALAYKAVSLHKLMAQIRDGKTKSTKKKTSLKGVIVSAVGGVLLGAFYPLLDMAKNSDIGLGPYSMAFMFAFGVFFSTFVYNLFFMNLPVQGKPLELGEYFKGKGRQHLMGLLGGALFIGGVIAAFVSERATGPASASPALYFGLARGGVILAALWGVFYWKEFAGTEAKVRTFVIVMLVLLSVGVVALSVAQTLGIQAQA